MAFVREKDLAAKQLHKKETYYTLVYVDTTVVLKVVL